ncbi:methyltransferase, partial [Vibrio sp. 10N.261.45.A7]
KEWLEWCSGKGFLGRILSQQSDQKVTSFEWQQSLCESGQKIADDLKLEMSFVQGDAFSDDADNVFNSDQHAVALHACGDLHVELVKKSVSHGLPAVTISPCCYHLIRDEYYQPMSQLAKASALTLSKSDLRIPLQETVTGGERVKRHRQLEMSYRLGFSQLLKTEKGIDEYIPVPSIKKSELAEGFESFCRWASEVKELSLGSDIDFDSYLVQGESLFCEMEKLSLVQQVFRRPLEIWLALDRALYLQEQGYEASIEEFCERSITPRNLLIHGVKI